MKRNRISFFCLIIQAVLFFWCCTGNNREHLIIRRNIDFNTNWKYIKNGFEGPEQINFNDARWKTIDLPHDISVEDLPVQDSSHVGPFYRRSERGGDVGYLTGGTAWYRKHFKTKKSDSTKQYILHFDGIQTEAYIFVNGVKVHENKNGYTPFNVNITSYLNKPGSENIIMVKVSNNANSSRWYPGFGIYRDVKLSILPPIHIANWGVFVTTPKINHKDALVNLSVKLENYTHKNDSILLIAHIISPEKNIVNTIEKKCSVSSRNANKTDLAIAVKEPKLWETETPELYTLKLEVLQNNLIIDEYKVDFGIRSIEFSAEKGFLLNGKEKLLKGACLHHDNGLLGAAAFKRAEYRRVEILKRNGYNSVRTSHNPPSKYFLEACDKFGIIVIEEAFDQWELPKRKNDYHQYFKDNWEKDIEAMIYRDRNHPSVIMWSIGNEIQERARAKGIEIAKMLNAKVRRLDDTRPNTQAVCDFWDNPDMNWEKHTPAIFEITDIAGYNYMPHKFEPDHQLYPKRIMYTSESMPKNSYENWKKVKELPYVIGDYVWTGMDYIGEAGIGISKYVEKEENLWHPQSWPWFNAYCGDIDLIGNKKPQSFYRDVVWENSKMEMLVHAPVPEGKWEQIHEWGWPNEEPHWNWIGNEGDTLQVNVYSAYSMIKLFLNNELVGQKEIDTEKGMVASFKLPYQAGELKAAGSSPGTPSESKSLRTTGKAEKIKLVAERNTITGRVDELVFVNVFTVDSENAFVPTADLTMTVNVEGEGRLQAAGNSNPLIEGSFQDNKFKLFKGRGLVIIRSSGKAGNISLSVSSENGLTENVLIKAI